MLMPTASCLYINACVHMHILETGDTPIDAQGSADSSLAKSVGN